MSKPTEWSPTVDRYALGNAIRIAWQRYGSGSWCSIADDVIAAMAAANKKPRETTMGEHMSRQLMPPDHLIQEWESEWRRQIIPGETLACELYPYFCSKAAQWGLDACRKWLIAEGMPKLSEEMYAALNKKAPSLKEQAKIELANLVDDMRRHGLGYSSDSIRRALEALPNE